MQNLNSYVSPTDTLQISVRGDRDTIIATIDSIDGIISREEFTSGEQGVYRFDLKVEKNTDLRDTIFFSMAEKHCAVIAMERKESSLESIFLSLTGDDPAAETYDEEDERLLNVIMSDRERTHFLHEAKDILLYFLLSYK